MNEFVTKMRLKEMAEEDIWFARRDQELLDALRGRRLAEQAGCRSERDQLRARQFEKEFNAIEKSHHRRRPRLIRACRLLLDRIRMACSQRH
jgi:hypothetical protein